MLQKHSNKEVRPYPEPPQFPACADTTMQPSACQPAAHGVTWPTWNSKAYSSAVPQRWQLACKHAAACLQDGMDALLKLQVWSRRPTAQAAPAAAMVDLVADVQRPAGMAAGHNTIQRGSWPMHKPEQPVNGFNGFLRAG